MPQGKKKLTHRTLARNKAKPYQKHRDAKRTKKGGQKRKAKSAKGYGATNTTFKSRIGSWTRNVEAITAQKLRSTGATIHLRDLKEKAGEQAVFEKERMLQKRNKTRAAQAERKAKRLIAVATKELEELVAPVKPAPTKAKKK